VEGKRKERKKKIKGKRNFLIGGKFENNLSGEFSGFGCGREKLSEKYQMRLKIKYLGTTHKNFQKSRILF